MCISPIHSGTLLRIVLEVHLLMQMDAAHPD